MKLKLTKFKSSGKWYTDEGVLVDEEYRYELTEYMKENFKNSEFHIFVQEVIDEDYIQPIRLYTIDDLRQQTPQEINQMTVRDELL